MKNGTVNYAHNAVTFSYVFWYYLSFKIQIYIFFLLWIDLDSINSHNVSSAQETAITHLLSYCFLQF